jgi:Endonuclease/Exonuclease/phosphatase family
MKIKALTWNVLHRTHAETHGESVIANWPIESKRIEKITEFISDQFDQHSLQVALLQEVSGDQLEHLRLKLSGHSVLNHVSPRAPKQKSNSLKDSSEHLVFIGPQDSQFVNGHTFENDLGKGFLVASAFGVPFISTHVSWGNKREIQLKFLCHLKQEFNTLCIGGDFNVEREIVQASMGANFQIGIPLAGSRNTHPKSTGGNDIDHIVTRNLAVTDVTVLNAEHLSDHNPVLAHFEILA